MEVSIGMPVRNGAKYLASALESLASQTYEKVTIVLLDNASTDHTAEICAQFAQGMNLVYLRNDKPVSAVRNFNRVMKATRGPLFMWAACDDLWDSRFVEEMVDQHSSGTFALTFCKFTNFLEDGTIVRHFDTISSLSQPAADNRLRHFLELDDFSSGKANLIYGLMRRESLEDIGGLPLFGRTSWGAENIALMKLLHKQPMAWSPNPLFHKRVSQRVGRLSIRSAIRERLLNVIREREYVCSLREALATLDIDEPLRSELIGLIRERGRVSILAAIKRSLQLPERER
jgi:glycosyltransferase involved in cell wall biosynthesis